MNNDNDEHQEYSHGVTSENEVPPRPEIRLPGRNRKLSEFGEELGATLASKEFYSKDGIVVIPDPDEEKPALKLIDAQSMRTAIEEHVDPFQYYKKGDEWEKCAKTLNTDDANGLLKCPQFVKQLRKARRLSNARFPIRRQRSGSIELLPEGYDEESQIITRSTCEVEEMTQAEGVAFLRDFTVSSVLRRGKGSREAREEQRKNTSA